jgi:hypothetical protein
VYSSALFIANTALYSLFVVDISPAFMLQLIEMDCNTNQNQAHIPGGAGKSTRCPDDALRILAGLIAHRHITTHAPGDEGNNQSLEEK